MTIKRCGHCSNMRFIHNSIQRMVSIHPTSCECCWKFILPGKIATYTKKRSIKFKHISGKKHTTINDVPVWCGILIWSLWAIIRICGSIEWMKTVRFITITFNNLCNGCFLRLFISVFNLDPTNFYPTRIFKLFRDVFDSIQIRRLQVMIIRWIKIGNIAQIRLRFIFVWCICMTINTHAPDVHCTSQKLLFRWISAFQTASQQSLLFILRHGNYFYFENICDFIWLSGTPYSINQ